MLGLWVKHNVSKRLTMIYHDIVKLGHRVIDFRQWLEVNQVRHVGVICNAAQLAGGGTILKCSWSRLYSVTLKWCWCRVWSGVQFVVRSCKSSVDSVRHYYAVHCAVQVTLETRLAVSSCTCRAGLCSTSDVGVPTPCCDQYTSLVLIASQDFDVF